MSHPLYSAFETAQLTLDLLNPQLKLDCFKFDDESYSPLYSQVLANRRKYYRIHAPHLLDENELRREKEIDARSFIISVRSNNSVIASLRLTPHPYELSDHDVHQFDFRQFADFLEIGRLVIDPDMALSSSALLVRYMLCGTGLIAFSKLGSPGFVAICRPYRLQIFTKFGLNRHFDIFSAQRKIHYCFLSGTADAILTATSELQANEKVFRKRLERISGGI